MTVATDLSELQEKLADARKVLTTKVGANSDIVKSTEIVEGVLRFKGDDAEKARTDFNENLKAIKELKAFIDGAEVTLGEKEFLSRPANAPVGPGVNVPDGLWVPGMGNTMRKSVGQMVIDSDEFKSLAGGRNGYTMQIPTSLKVGDLPSFYRGQKDVYSALPSGSPGSFGIVQRDPLVQRQRRTARVRDLFAVQKTNASVIEFFRQTGFVNNASPVAERNAGNSDFAAKPHSTISFVGESTNIRTIAHWEAAHRNALADEPQLRGIIDTELLYGLALVEDAQILSGTGTSEDLPGVLNDPDIQDYSWSEGPASAHENKADALRRAATLVTLAYYEPTGVVVHDSDWEDMELLKDDNGQYLLAVSIALGGEPRVWRMPVVSTPAMPVGTALVGAFGLAAQLYDREDATIRVAEQHADFFIKNAVVILAEERLGLAMKRPEAFVEVTFDHAPT